MAKSFSNGVTIFIDEIVVRNPEEGSGLVNISELKSFQDGFVTFPSLTHSV